MSKQSTPNISVIIPVYKPPLNYFKDCLDSLCSQTMSNAEFIIVFDGNDEVLYSFCKNYQKNDPRFKLYVQPHLGVSATRNFGIKQSSGEYITFVDADDWIESKCCQSTYDFAKENDSDIVLFDYIPVDGQNERKEYADRAISKFSSEEITALQEQTIALTDHKYISVVSTWGKIIKKSLVSNNAISFPTNIHIAVDRPFMFRVYLFAKNISYINDVFYNYNKVEGSISYKKYYNKDIKLLDYLIEIKKISNKFPQQIGKQAFILLEDAWNYFYFNKKDNQSYLCDIKYLCGVIQSQSFQDLISETTLQDYPLIKKIELFLLKHKITILLWIRTFKRILF